MRRFYFIGIMLVFLLYISSGLAEKHSSSEGGSNEYEASLQVNVSKRELINETEITVTVHNPFSYSVRDVYITNLLPEGLQYSDYQNYSGCLIPEIEPNSSTSQTFRLRKAGSNRARLEADDALRFSVDTEKSFTETDTAILAVTIENLSLHNLLNIDVSNVLPNGLIYPLDKHFDGNRIDKLEPFEIRHLKIFTQKEIIREEQKVEEVPLDKVPPELKHKFETVEQIKDQLTNKMFANFINSDNNKVEYFSVKLMISHDGGRTWVEATKENFPLEGIRVRLPFPSGTNGKQYRFVVSHMYTVSWPERGWHVGQVDLPPVTWDDDGLWVTFKSLSPVAIAWEKIDDSVVDLPKTGDNSNPAMWISLGLLSFVGLFLLKRRSI